MVPHRSTIIVSVVSLLLAVSHVACSNDKSWGVYYVKPSEAEQCSPHLQPCYTLQYYVNNSNFSSNSTFLFLKGLHILQGILEIRNVTNLALIGVCPEKCKIQALQVYSSNKWFMAISPYQTWRLKLWSRVSRWSTLWSSCPRYCLWSELDQCHCRKHHWLWVTWIQLAWEVIYHKFSFQIQQGSSRLSWRQH